eukprot:557193-Amphidinium_carterae.1
MLSWSSQALRRALQPPARQDCLCGAIVVHVCHQVFQPMNEGILIGESQMLKALQVMALLWTNEHHKLFQPTMLEPQNLARPQKPPSVTEPKRD